MKIDEIEVGAEYRDDQLCEETGYALPHPLDPETASGGMGGQPRQSRCPRNRELGRRVTASASAAPGAD
jgi:hypothetical protein